MTTHYEIYRSYTNDELAAEITDLKARRKAYQSQSAGGKSYTQDLSRLDEALQAAVRVQRERSRSATGEDSRAVASFEGSAYRG